MTFFLHFSQEDFWDDPLLTLSVSTPLKSWQIFLLLWKFCWCISLKTFLGNRISIIDAEVAVLEFLKEFIISKSLLIDINMSLVQEIILNFICSYFSLSSCSSLQALFGSSHCIKQLSHRNAFCHDHMLIDIYFSPHQIESSIWEKV